MRIRMTTFIHILLLAIIAAIGIFIYTFARDGGEISLALAEEEGSTKVTVTAENLSYPFFGTAFHLHYDPNLYTFNRYTLGDYFEISDDPVVLVRESEPGTLIAGISLKRGHTIDKEGGTLLTFYFTGGSSAPHEDETGNFTFSNTVFSTFDEERKDLDNIDFYSKL